MTIEDLFDYWWNATREERIALCQACGGLSCDADYNDPDEYIISAVLENPRLIGW